jgi:hypothetical protein
MNRSAVCFLGAERLDGAVIAAQHTAEDIYVIGSSPVWETRESRIHYFCIQTVLQQSLVMHEIAWMAAAQTLQVICQPGWEEFGAQLEEYHYGAHGTLSEVADFGWQALKQARGNWKENGPFRCWDLLRGRFKDVPAVVCGAGPSLQEAARSIEAASSRALILAAGTAWPLMNSWGIAPHIAFMLEKQTSLDMLTRCIFSETACCFQSRLCPTYVHWLHGEKILAPESGPLPWENWWIKESQPVSLGWTVGNFTMQAAIWMGCNPIILAGMDFCYQNNKKYPGLPAGSATLIEYRGKKTQSDWLLAARWTEQLCQEHPEIRWINTSLDGLPLMMETTPLSQIHLAKQFDLTGRLHQALQGAPWLSLDDYSAKAAEWDESWVRCRSGTDLSDEIVYRHYLEPLWRIWEPVFLRQAQGQDMNLHRLLFFRNVLQNWFT